MTLRVGVSGGAARRERRRASSVEAERLGADSVWVAGVLGRRRAHPARLPRRADLDDPAGHRHRPARRPDAGHARHVGAVVAGAVRRPLRARHRHQRAAGHGGLARRPVRPAGPANPRDDRDHPHDHAPASGSSTTARSTRCRCPTARAAHPLAHARRRTSRSTSPRSVPPTCGSPASSPTAGSATRSCPRRADVFLDPIREGAARGRDATSTELDLTVAVGVEFTDDVEEAGRRHAEGYAFTFGAMGSATTNFYNDAFARQGYGDDVREVQRLWLAGDQDAAPPAGPDRDRPRHQPDRHRRPRPRPPPPLPRRRRHDAPRRPRSDRALGLDGQLADLARLLDLVGRGEPRRSLLADLCSDTHRCPRPAVHRGPKRRLARALENCAQQRREHGDRHAGAAAERPRGLGSRARHRRPPHATHAVDTTDSFEAGVRSLAAHGDVSREPRRRHGRAAGLPPKPGRSCRRAPGRGACSDVRDRGLTVFTQCVKAR